MDPVVRAYLLAFVMADTPMLAGRMLVRPCCGRTDEMNAVQAVRIAAPPLDACACNKG